MADRGVSIAKAKGAWWREAGGRTKLIDVTDKRKKSLAKGFKSSWRDMEMKKKRENEGK